MCFFELFLHEFSNGAPAPVAILVKKFVLHTDAVNFMCVRDSIAITASRDSTLRSWDLEDMVSTFPTCCHSPHPALLSVIYHTQVPKAVFLGYKSSVRACFLDYRSLNLIIPRPNLLTTLENDTAGHSLSISIQPSSHNHHHATLTPAHILLSAPTLSSL